MLFSSYTRIDTEPAEFAESYYSYLDRSAREEIEQVRNKLEEWYDEYPSEYKEEIKSSICSNDNLSFISAFFVLYMHQLLLGMEYKIEEIYPEVPNSTSRPDFLVYSENCGFFYLEVAITIKSKEKLAAKERIINTLYESLNKIESPNFYLGIRYSGRPDPPVPGKRIREFIENKLKELNPDDYIKYANKITKDKLPIWKFKHKDYILDIYPIPKSPTKRGNTDIRPIALMMPENEDYWCTNSTSIKNTIEEKAKKYGDFNKPYIIAINILSSFVDKNDVLEALFGKEEFYIKESNSSKIVMRKNSNGALIQSNISQNTKVSGILVGNNIDPYNIASGDIRLYHNPWAQYPITNQLEDLPKAYVINNNIEWSGGIPPTKVFNLPVGWP